MKKNVTAVKAAARLILFLFGITLLCLLFGLPVLFDGRTKQTVRLENTRVKQTLVIDPGHGGEDGGAEANGVVEKNVNLAISAYLREFMKITDTETVMTRTDDRLLYQTGETARKKYYDIQNRIALAKSFPDAFLVSIHQNKFGIPKYKGLQVYYSPNHDDSARLAALIQQNARSFLDESNKREIKKADSRIRLLNTVDMPAVLVECGFLSNPEEAARLADEAYQKKTAFVLFVSILQFIEENGERSA